MKIIIKSYEEKYFNEILENLYNFQLKTEMTEFLDMFKYKTYKEQKLQLKKDLRELIDNSTHTFITWDEKQNRVHVFCTFNIIDNDCHLTLIFQPNDYHFIYSMKPAQALFNLGMRLANTDKIRARIQRNKTETYIKYLNRYYNVEILDDNYNMLLYRKTIK